MLLNCVFLFLKLVYVFVCLFSFFPTISWCLYSCVMIDQNCCTLSKCRINSCLIISSSNHLQQLLMFQMPWKPAIYIRDGLIWDGPLSATSTVFRDRSEMSLCRFSSSCSYLFFRIFWASVSAMKGSFRYSAFTTAHLIFKPLTIFCFSSPSSITYLFAISSAGRTNMSEAVGV